MSTTFAPRYLLAIAICLAWTCHAEAAPRFTAPPKTTRTGETIRIDFAVSEPTDVSVFIEDLQGNVVRHLVAGVLGKNPPAPLTPNSLQQSISWDGKSDYNRPTGEGPFRVRVALGLSARYENVVLEDKLAFSQIRGMATDDEGTLYVIDSFGAHVPNWRSWRLLAFKPDGRYDRMIFPPAGSFTEQQFHDLGIQTATVAGKAIPLFTNLRQRSLVPHLVSRKSPLAIAASGEILMLYGDCVLASLRPDGSASGNRHFSKPLFPKLNNAGLANKAFLAIGSDGQTVYMTGIGEGSRKIHPAIYRTRLPQRDEATLFFGDAKKTGKDLQQLGGRPHGIATDGQGRLFVADPGNNRILVIEEQTGKAIGSVAIEAADELAIDKKSGALYATRLLAAGRIEVVKIPAWQKRVVTARTQLEREGNPAYPWSLALDTSAERPRLLFGGDQGTLYQVIDQGDKFSKPAILSSKSIHNGAFVDIQVNRFDRQPELFARCTQGRWFRYTEKTGKLKTIELSLPGAAGTCVVPGPGGLLYAPAYPYHLYRFDRNGKPVPWPKDFQRYPVEHKNNRTKKIEKTKFGPAHARFAPVSMTFMTHTIGVRHDGRVFMFDPGFPRLRPPKMLREYTTDQNKPHSEPILWKVSDTAVGPKFDPQGNIYIAEQIKPLGKPAPAEFQEVIGEVKFGYGYAKSYNQPRGVLLTSYGSIVKFSPRGGMIHYEGLDPFAGEPKLDPSLKTEQAMYYRGERRQQMEKVKITGAEWFRVGPSHVALHYCNCENIRFDVDEFGRVFYPDLCRFRVCVLDTNGNPVTEFGRYGNADSNRDKQRGDDVGFGWLTAVGVTDRFIYTGDSLNKRLLQLKKQYAQEATVSIE